MVIESTSTSSDFYCLDAQIDSRGRKEAFGELRLKFLPLDHLKAESLLGIGTNHEVWTGCSIASFFKLGRFHVDMT